MKTLLRWNFCLLILALPLFGTAQYTITSVAPTSVQQGYQGSLTITTSSGQPFTGSSSGYILRISGPSQAYNNNSWSYPSSNTSMSGGISIPSNALIGNYNVTLENWDQFGPTTWTASSIFEITPLVSIDPSKEIAISAGPNPVKDKLLLRFPANDNARYKVGLFNMDGKQLRAWEIETGLLQEHQLDFQQLASGHYFLQVQNENFKRSFRIFVQP